MLSWRSLRLSFFSFHSFFILLCFHYFHHSMFQLTYPVFGLNAPTKRYTLAEQIKKTISIYILFTTDIPQAKGHVQTKNSAVVLLKCIFYSNYCVVIKHFLYILNPHINPIYLCLHFISEILDHLYYHYSEFFFRQTAYVLSICLVLLVFHHAPSSTLCFSVFSFCLINVFGVSFPPLARLQVPFTCEVCSPGWGWTSVL